MFTARVFGSLEEAEPVWRSFEEDGGALPYQLFDWVAAQETSSRRASTFEPAPVAVSTSDGKPLFFLPLDVSASVRNRIPVRSASWLGAAFADQQAPIVTEAGAELDAASFRSAWAAVGAALESVDLVDLRRQPDAIYGRRNPLSHLGLTQHAEAHSTRLQPGWDEYHASKVGGRSRKNSRRRLRRLSEVGDVVFRVVSDPEEMDQAIVAMIEQKRARYRQTGKDDFFADAENAGFHQTIVRRRPDISHMMVCTLDGEIVATDWGIIHGSTLHGMMTGFELEWGQYSVGRLLTERVLEWSCENGIEEYDFSIGDEPYKQDWCEITTPLRRGSIPMSARGRAVLLPGQIRRSVESYAESVKLPDAVAQRLARRRKP